MAVDAFGVAIGVERSLALVAIPLALVALFAAAYLRAGGDWSRRKRAAFVLVRALVVVCLVTAAAGPYTVTERETAGDPRVRLLVDESNSMAATDANASDLASAIENAGVPVTTSTVAVGNRSRVGDGALANVERNASLLLLSDGQVTGGRSLASVAGVAREANATLHAVRVGTTATDRRVSLAGPSTASAGVENSYLVASSGVGTEGPATVTVRADGTPVFTERLAAGERAEFTHTFDETGVHRLTATVETEDAFAVDDTYRRTVRVVPKPRVLYVARDDYPLGGLLDRLYNVTRRESIPDDLSRYQAVVTQDLPADAAGNVTALQRAVIDGTGYVAVGGDNAFENGGYNRSALGSLVPVESGTERRRSARLVLLVDISASSAAGSSVQKGLALDALDQLGPRNRVGIVAFNEQPYLVAPVARLAGNRSELESRIRRLETGKRTNVAAGLRGARDALDGAGTVIMLSDGRQRLGRARDAAESLAGSGVRVITVGVGEEVNEPLLRDVARTTGGSYLRGGDTSRLRLLFGDRSSYEGSGLTVVDGSQFITTGLELSADPALGNDVSVKPGADYLVATGDGTSAAAQWRYGLGRVVSITAYGADGTLDGLLTRPDSLLLSKSVNWAVGDPTEGSGVATAADTRVGEPTTVRYEGPERPEGPPAFRRVGPNSYRATVTPTTVGYRNVSTAAYAANYPREYDAFGTSEALERAVERTGGRLFAPSRAEAIARTVTRRARRVREVRDEWDTHLLVAGLLLFVAEVLARRVTLIRRNT